MEKEEILRETYGKYMFKYAFTIPSTPLPKEDVRILLALLTWDTQAVPIQLEKEYIDSITNSDLKQLYIVLMGTLSARIIYSRLKAIDIEIGIPAIAWLSTFLKSPGDAVMYAHYIAYRFKKGDIEGVITLDSLLSKVFPRGRFSEEQLLELWDTQKVHMLPDNLLDHPMAWEFKSI